MLRNAQLALPAMLLALALPGFAWAQEQDKLAQANNPLAQVTAFNVQAYVIDELTDINEGASQLLFRFATPFSVGKTNWLLSPQFCLDDFVENPTHRQLTNIRKVAWVSIAKHYEIPITTSMR